MNPDTLCGNIQPCGCRQCKEFMRNLAKEIDGLFNKPDSPKTSRELPKK